MRSRWCALSLVIAVLASACTAGREASDLVLIEGQVEVEGLDGWQPAAEVKVGQRVRAAERAIIGRGADELILAQDTTVVLGADQITVARGDVTLRGASTRMVMGDVAIESIGIVRAQTGVAPRVVTYSGTALISRPGERHRLGELRQIVLTAQRFDGSDDPISYSPDDPVDAVHLQAAIAFDREVERYTTTLTEQYGRNPQPTAFYASFTDLSEDEAAALVESAPVRDDVGSVGPPAEALVGLFVARAVAAADDGVDIGEASRQVDDLRDEGARWGLIAMALRLEQVVFAATVDTAVVQRQDFLVTSAGGAAGGTSAPAAGSGGGQPAAVPATPADPAPPQPAAPPADPEPPQDPPPPAPEIVPEPVEQLIDEVLGQGLLGVLLS